MHGSVVVQSWWSTKLMFQSRQRLGIDDWMSLALKFFFAQASSLWYLLVAIPRIV